MAGITSTKFSLLELRDCKLKVLSATDAPTGTAIDIPGIMRMVVSPKIETKELKGDCETLEVYSKVTGIELDIECAQVSLDVLKLIQGGDVTKNPTVDPTSITYSLTAANTTPPYFYLEGQQTYGNTECADIHYKLYKVKATDAPSFEVNDASGNFGTLKFKAKAVATKDPANDGKWFDIVLNQTLTPIA